MAVDHTAPLVGLLEQYRDTIVVVETDDDRHLGIVEPLGGGYVAIRSGYRGRPAIVAYDDIDTIVMAISHPDAAVSHG